MWEVMLPGTIRLCSALGRPACATWIRGAILHLLLLQKLLLLSTAATTAVAMSSGTSSEVFSASEDATIETEGTTFVSTY